MGETTFLLPTLVVLTFFTTDFFVIEAVDFFVVDFLTTGCGLGVGVAAKLDVPGASRAVESRIDTYRHLRTMKVFCRIGAGKG